MDALVRLRGRVSMMIVEHHAETVLPIVDRAYVLVNGQVAYRGQRARVGGRSRSASATARRGAAGADGGVILTRSLSAPRVVRGSARPSPGSLREPTSPASGRGVGGTLSISSLAHRSASPPHSSGPTPASGPKMP